MNEQMNSTVTEAISWRLASELCRRHPKTTRILITHPGGGQYNCLTIVNSQGGIGVIQLNRSGTIQVHQKFDTDRPSDWRATEWSEYLASDPLEFLKQLEISSGLNPPRDVPTSVPRTLTYRVLAALTATAIMTVRPLEVKSGFIDTSGDGDGPNGALEQFDAIPEKLLRLRPTDLNGEPGYRFWILTRAGVPILVIEEETATGWVQHRKTAIDLKKVFTRHHRNPQLVAFELLRRVDTL